MRTLYISDLDGTLLHSNAELSKFTAATVNSLVDRGMIFSYATARSYHSASKVTAELTERIPVIVFNGTFILENGTRRKLFENSFSESEAVYILDVLFSGGVYPFVHRYKDETETFVYLQEHLSRGAKAFAAERENDPRRRTAREKTELYGNGIFHFTCIDEKEKLEPLFERLKNDFHCIFYVDPYGGEQWLEVQPKGATKANAVKELKRIMNCHKIVCFGDAVNDLSMFSVADECYAVANACEELKRIATGVIPSNDEDGVANWLLNNFEGEENEILS